MARKQGTDQGRHIAMLRDRARRPDDKSRDTRATDDREAIEAELDAEDERLWEHYVDEFGWG